jgi:hypothetical protein
VTGRHARLLLVVVALAAPAGRARAQQPVPDSTATPPVVLSVVLPPVPPLRPLAAPRPSPASLSARRAALRAAAAGLARPPAPAAGEAFAEAAPDAVRVWKRSIELAGNLFVGSRPQTVLTTRGRASHADSTFEFTADMRFTYGETSQDGVREVSQRLWQLTTTLDLWPFAAQSPFLLGGVESSLERRIQLRVSGGIGHKMTFVDDGRSLANLSVAVLGERSRLPSAEGPVSEATLARLSTRLRLRRRFGDRATVSHETFYRPELYQITAFTFSNNLAATYRMTEVLNLKASYLDNYDSEARGRGARTNYDAQVVLGVLAEF